MKGSQTSSGFLEWQAKPPGRDLRLGTVQKIFPERGGVMTLATQHLKSLPRAWPPGHAYYYP